MNKHKKKPMSIKRLQVLLKQHLFDTGMMTAFVEPPYGAEEHAQARFLASQLLTQLGSDRDRRVRALVVTIMYQMQTQGVLQYLEELPSAANDKGENDKGEK